MDFTHIGGLDRFTIGIWTTATYGKWVIRVMGNANTTGHTSANTSCISTIDNFHVPNLLCSVAQHL
jgi:hypothetical protein